VDPSDAVKDIGGNSDTTFNFTYCRIEDTANPFLKSVDFVNSDGPNDTRLTPGDQFVFNFTETMDSSCISYANVNTQLLPTDGIVTHTYDVRTTDQFGWSRPDFQACIVIVGDTVNIVSQWTNGDSVYPAGSVRDRYTLSCNGRRHIALLETAPPICRAMRTRMDFGDTIAEKIEVFFSERFFNDLTGTPSFWLVDGSFPDSITNPSFGAPWDTTRILWVSKFGTGDTPLVEYTAPPSAYEDMCQNALQAFSIYAEDRIAPRFTATHSPNPVDSLVYIEFTEPVQGTMAPTAWTTGVPPVTPRAMTGLPGRNVILYGCKIDADSTLIQYNTPPGDLEDMATIPNAHPFYSVYATERTDVSFDITMYTGWNMLSVPVTVSETGVDLVFPGNAAVYTYANGAYTVPTDVAVGVGYWVLRQGADTLITITGTPVTSYLKTVYPYWNMIGSVTDTVPVTDIRATPDSLKLPLYWYDPSTSGYVTETSVIPTHGYWAGVTDTCDLVVEKTSKFALPAKAEVENDLLWSVDLRIESEGVEKTLTLGAAHGATPGIDKGIDILEPPPPPPLPDRGGPTLGNAVLPTESIAAHFKNEVLTLKGCATDIREPEAKEWKLAVSANDFTVNWSAADIPENLDLTLLIDGKAVDMRDQTSVSGDGASTIKILVNKKAPMPKVFALSQNMPNPFTRETEIKFQLPTDVHTTVTIYNLVGQSIRTLVNAPTKAGYHTVSWDGRDDSGAKVGNGVYFCKFHAGEFTAIKKLTILK
jgi:hypothetical protein